MRYLKDFQSVFRTRAVAIVFAFTLLSTICFCQGNVAEAGANINWKTTSVSLEPGRAIVHGYFYNTGNSRAGITKFEIWGYIGPFRMNVTYSGSNLGVGSLGGGNRINWTFTIRDNSISYYDSNPRYNFNSRVTWN